MDEKIIAKIVYWGNCIVVAYSASNCSILNIFEMYLVYWKIPYETHTIRNREDLIPIQNTWNYNRFDIHVLLKQDVVTSMKRQWLTKILYRSLISFTVYKEFCFDYCRMEFFLQAISCIDLSIWRQYQVFIFNVDSLKTFLIFWLRKQFLPSKGENKKKEM